MLVDTDVLIWHLRGYPQATRRLDLLPSLTISVVSYLEVLQGMRDKAEFALTVTTDEPIFGKDEDGPDDDLRLQFEAISQFDEEDQELARGLLEGLIFKHQAKQSMARAAARATPVPAPKASAKRAAARA